MDDDFAASSDSNYKINADKRTEAWLPMDDDAGNSRYMPHQDTKDPKLLGMVLTGLLRGTITKATREG